jgi:hypothetical protein
VSDGAREGVKKWLLVTSCQFGFSFFFLSSFLSLEVFKGFIFGRLLWIISIYDSKAGRK